MIEYIGTMIEGGAFGKVFTISQILSSFLVPWVTAGLTLWITAFGLATIRGEVQQPAMTFAWRAIKVAMILYLALGVGAYQTEIVGTINKLTADLISSVSSGGFSSKCKISFDSTNNGIVSAVYSFLDCQFGESMKVALGFFKAAINSIGPTSLLNMSGTFISVLVFLVGGIFIALAYVILFMVMTVEWLSTRVVLDIVLCLGPIFIAFLAFEPTKKYFDGWLSAVVFGIAMQVIFAIFLVICAGVLQGVTMKIFGATDPANMLDQLIGTPLNAIGVIFYLPLTVLILAWVFTKLSGIAGGLVGHSGSGGGLGTAGTLIAMRMISRGGFKLPKRPGGKMQQGTK